MFKIKKDEDENHLRCKTKLVIKSCAQKKELDYKEIYALVKITTVRILLSVINYKNLIAHQTDIKNVFLQDNVYKDVYIKLPDRFDIKDKNVVCKLNKALYGLKQTPSGIFILTALLKS